MARDSRVLRQAETKPVIDSESSGRHPTQISVKWRPPGRAINRNTLDFIPHLITRRRNPVNLGDVDGKVDVPAPPFPVDATNRSSREGKEQMRSKTSEDGMES